MTVIQFPVPPFKTCSCGRRYTSAEWAALPLVGYAGHHKAGGRMYACELKNCHDCHSTLAIEVEVSR